MIWVFFPLSRKKSQENILLGPFHPSCSFWTVFVCLLSSHSLCTAFTKTRSALPIGVSGLRSANPCVCHHRVVQAGSVSAAACQLWNCSHKLPPSPGAAGTLLRCQQHPAEHLLNLAISAGRGEAKRAFLGCWLLPLGSPHPWGLRRVGCEGHAATGTGQGG